MRKIKDERLVIKNLQNIRIAYFLQTIGIIGILGYDFITKGLDGMRENPLWLLFILTTIISAYLSMSISVDHESSQKSPKNSLTIALGVLTIIAFVVGLLVANSEGFTLIDGVILGGILFVCGFIPVIYIYTLRKKRQNE